MLLAKLHASQLFNFCVKFISEPVVIFLVFNTMRAELKTPSKFLDLLLIAKSMYYTFYIIGVV